MVKVLSFLFCLCFANANAQTLKVVTTEFPPFQVVDGEEVSGLTTEVVRAVAEQAGFKSEIRSYPWPRAFKIAQNEANVLIYSIVRNPDREKKFKWIGVVAPYEVYLWKLAERTDIKVNSLEDAKKYSISGVHSDIKAQYLVKKGFEVGKNLNLINHDEANLRMLYSKRIDLVPADKIGFYYRTEKAGYERSKFTRLLKLDGVSDQLYLAASLTTSDLVVAKLKKALEFFHKTKQYKNIQKKFK
jgi:polar amino acid transport system substrate-binding protein